MDTEQPVEKGARRKLKRIVKKKSKVGRNAPASVVYYKKVKAALNASLNSSRVRQTLQANNKALAQSLQQVKQELRLTLNENAHLRLEIQDLKIKVLRLENQGPCSTGQADLERRLHSLKTLLHQMSSHLLEVGTCINDGVDLCLLTPRTSQASASRPSSMEQFSATGQQDVAMDIADAPRVSVSSSEGLETSEVEEPVVTSMFPEHGGMGPVPLSLAAPDMSVIMEQSIIVDEGQQEVPHPMDPVLEEPAEVVPNGKRGKEKSTKPSGVSKLPQRVRNAGSSASSSEDEEDTLKKKALPRRKAKHLNTNSSESSESSSSLNNEQENILAKASPHAGRRGTFVVSKTPLVLPGDDAEGIDSVEMPELVGGVSASEEESSPKVCTTVPALQDSSTSKSSERKSPAAIKANDQPKKAVPEVKEVSVSSKLALKKKEPASKLSKATPFKKPAVLPPPRSNKRDESGFFISNPCALNLVHKRKTGTTDGCIGADGTMQKGSDGTAQKTSDTVNQFLATIRDSNSRSRKIASLSPSTKDDQNGQSVSCAVDAQQKVLVGDQESIPDGGEETVYFNADMEFTAILPATQSLETMEEVDSSAPVAQDSDKHSELVPKEQEDNAGTKEDAVKRARSRPRSKLGRSKGARSKDRESEQSDIDGGQSLIGEDKKLAVAMRVGKPGEMKFAASRKEEDGSRKAVPVTKARSKSKKKMEEMLKNLPSEEPKSIFDFHDKTPRQTESKPKVPASVFDISLDESCAGAVPSLASFRERLSVLTKGLDQGAADMCVPTSDSSDKSENVKKSLLGNAPEYRLPLKGDDSDNQPDPKPRSRGRSASKGRSSQSRSKSRGRKTDEENNGEENDDPETKCKRERSRSRARSKKAAENGDVDADFQEPKPRGRSRRRQSPEAADPEEEPPKDSNPDTLRRSARSKSQVRKTYTEDDNTESLDDVALETQGTEVRERGRSRSRHKQDGEDEEYQPSKASDAARSKRGRSRHRKGESGLHEDTDKEEAFQGQGTKTEHKESNSKTAQTEMCVDSVVNTEDAVGPKPARRKSSKDEKKREMLETGGNTDGCTDSDSSVPEPSSKITQRRHRSKSRRLYRETETADDAFGFFAELDTGAEPASESDAIDVGALCGETEKRKRRTKSRGKALCQTNVAEDAEPLIDSAVHKHSFGEVPAGSTGAADIDAEREQDSNTSNNRAKDSSTKDSADRSDHDHTDSSTTGESVRRSSLRKRSLSQSGSDSSSSSPLPVKKGKSGAPVSVDSGDGDKPTPSDNATVQRGRSKKKTDKAAVAESDSGKSEKDNYQLQFEEVKRKLHQLDTDSLHKDKDNQHQTVKKSRPLVLPPSLSCSKHKPQASSSKSLTSAVENPDAKAKSSLKSKTESKSQPCSPQEKTGRSSGSTATSLPAPSSARNSLQSSGDVERSGEADGRRARRAAAVVSYKEPSLHGKLRRGDPHTSFLHKEEMLHIYKSPKGPAQRKRSGAVAREVFTDLTNQSIAEVE